MAINDNARPEVLRTMQKTARELKRLTDLLALIRKLAKDDELSIRAMQEIAEVINAE